MKLQRHDLSYFLGKFFFGGDGFQNMFVCQPTLDTFRVNKDKGTGFSQLESKRGAYF